jgi:putative NADH-flavin reductase
MKVVVFGPTGMVGSRIVAELEQRGHDVVGASRSGGTDVTDPDSVASAVAGADAVVCAVSTRGADYTLADVARSVIGGVRRVGVSRLVTIGGTGSLEVAPGVRYVDTPTFNDEYKPEALQHADALEVYRGVDDLDWTVVSPAAYIHPGERTGRYRLGGDQMLVDAGGKSEISAEDYAVAIADLLEQHGHARERVGVAW